MAKQTLQILRCEHRKIFNPLTTNNRIETSQLICKANQLTGFYVRGTFVR